MSVIIKYVVERDGVEVKVFSEKKEAEAYDKLLDASDALSSLIITSGIDFQTKNDKELIDKISYHLAKNAPTVVGILKGIKPGNSAPPGKQKEKSKINQEKPSKKTEKKL